MKTTVAIFLLALALPSITQAAPIVVFTSVGSVSGSLQTPTGSGTFVEQEGPTTTGVAISGGVSSGPSFSLGSWNSEAGDSSLEVLGLLNIVIDLPVLQSGFGNALANYSAAFTLTEPMQYELTFNFVVDGGDRQAAAGGMVFFADLFPLGFNTSGPPIGFLSETGVLDPGSHLLSVDLNATQFRLGFASERPGPQETTVRIDLALTLTPTDAQVVPEPAAILLMGTGLAVATLKRRV